MTLEEIPISEVPIHGVFIVEDAYGNYHIGKRTPRPKVFPEGLIPCGFYWSTDQVPGEIEDANEWEFGWLKIYNTVVYTGVILP